MNGTPATRADVEARQLEALRRLLRAIAPANAFYATRLAAAGIDGGLESLEQFRRTMPFTAKSDLQRDQDEHPPYGSNLTYPLERYARIHQTSSTTGRPLRWLDTSDGWSWMVDGWVDVLGAAGVTAADRVFVASAFGPFIGLWLAFEAAARMGCLTIPGGAMSSATRLKAMLANRGTVLCATPTYALHLGEVARQEGIDLGQSDVRVIVVGGEPGASLPGMRHRMESLWPGARLFDHYGMTEVGPVTLQCPHRPGAMHVRETAYLCELVEPETGEAIPDESTDPGEIVLTTLGRAGSPMLRYRTGDLARRSASPSCACGRPTVLLEGGIVRADDMVVVRGVNLFPSAVDEIVRSVQGVAEYRVEVDATRALAELKIAVEPAPDCRDPGALCRELERAFRDAYSLRVPIDTVPPGSLPRFELKARRWVKR